MLINTELYFIRNRAIRKDNKNPDAADTANKVKTKKQIFDEFKAKVKDMLDPTNGMSDEEKVSYDEKIDQKIKKGEKLSSEEMQYIRIKSPYMYVLISKVQMQREALENKLKNCRSKEEVEEVYTAAITHIDKDDPARVPLQAAYDNVTREFKKSSEYKKLPLKTEHEKEKKPEVVKPDVEADEFESRYFQAKDVDSIVDIKV